MNEASNDHTLLHLGPGEGSKVEHIKANSHHLRGQIAQELATETTHFSEEQVQLIKFHGMYQQEDRDLRQVRREEKAEKAYQFMIRSRIPGGVLTAEQYLVQDDLADRYANGTLRITTRQGLQLHGILKGDLHAALRGINESLLSTLAACGDVNRNVMACPAPTASRAQSKVRKLPPGACAWLHRAGPYVIWLTEKVQTVEAPEMLSLSGATYLPRKFKIGVAFW
jgi:sulfite reductase (ferredoxin)